MKIELIGTEPCTECGKTPVVANLIVGDCKLPLCKRCTDKIKLSTKSRRKYKKRLPKTTKQPKKKELPKTTKNPKKKRHKRTPKKKPEPSTIDQDIIDALGSKNGKTIKELKTELGSSVTAYRLEKLVSAGYLVAWREGKAFKYYIKTPENATEKPQAQPQKQKTRVPAKHEISDEIWDQIIADLDVQLSTQKKTTLTYDFAHERYGLNRMQFYELWHRISQLDGLGSNPIQAQYTPTPEKIDIQVQELD